MAEKFYVIQEEFFSEDLNDSSYEPLNDLLFKSRKEAEEYLVKYIAENNFESFIKEPLEGFYLPEGKEREKDECRFVVTDESFPQKYQGEGHTKNFYINVLTLFKIS